MMKSKSISLSLFLLLLACNPQDQELSVSKEQIDSANKLIQVYGLSSMPTYDELLQHPSVMIKNADGSQRFPWVDTYWPTQEKNLARRWSHILKDDEKNRDQFSDFYVASYFQTEIDALAQNQSELSIYLAPAEKFDILYRSKKGLMLDANNADLVALRKVEDKHMNTDFSALGKDALDTARTIAYEYSEILYTSQMEEKADALTAVAPMSSEGIMRWLDGSANYQNKFPGMEGEGTDWSWEGICHGWAPAAIYAEEPKFAVKVEVSVGDAKKDLILTEGDIRGLLSKTWADAGNEETFFIGRRCEADLADAQSRGPVNAQGRSVTGKLSYEQQGALKETQFTIVQDYPRGTDSQANLMRVILESEWKDGSPKYAYLIERKKQAGQEPDYKLVFDEAQAFSEVEKGVPAADSAKVQQAELFGCWDVNPASFHTVLVENIGKRNLGFVMDRTQSAQVWNQPVGAAEFEIGELKELSVLGSEDPARFYRAPGTKYIAEVTASVHWGAEPAKPSFNYGTHGDLDAKHSKTNVYNYTLEFDADKRVIGGEWGKLGQMRPDQQNPDFLFGFTEIVAPNLEYKPYMKDGYQEIIKKIHDCSLQGKADGQTEVKSVNDSGMDVIRFVSCKLD